MPGGASLSIVVPVLNEAEGIAASLQALRGFRARGVEIIVVDGGSDDRSTELAAPLADRVLIAPRGRARQMNAGAALAHGDILLFLHADTRLPEAADALVAGALRGAARCHWGRFDIALDGRSAVLPVVAAMMNRRSRLFGIATGDQALFVTRKAFDAVGGFPDIALMEDIELSRRLLKLGPPACIAEKVIASARRWEQHGVWRTIGLMWWLRLRYFFGADPQRLAKAYGDASR